MEHRSFFNGDGFVQLRFLGCAAGAQGKDEKIIQGREYVKLYER
jgi:hypothetical protein